MLLNALAQVMTDEDLLIRIQQGESEAVIHTYEQYFRPLYQYVRLKVGDANLAEDITSDVFVRLLESLGTKSAPRKHLRGWLFRVARSEIAAQVGKLRRLPLANLEEWMPAPTETNPETQLFDLFDMQRVRHALRMLNDEHQEVLILRFGQRLSLQETAEMMGKSVSAIKSLQFRAVHTLRQILINPNPEVSNG